MYLPKICTQNGFICGISSFFISINFLCTHTTQKKEIGFREGAIFSGFYMKNIGTLHMSRKERYPCLYTPSLSDTFYFSIYTF